MIPAELQNNGYRFAKFAEDDHSSFTLPLLCNPIAQIG